MQSTKEKSALIAMSGGVDSSVAAYLMLQQGYECQGTTMRLYRNADIGLNQFHTCCSQRDIDDASEVAFQLDIPYEVLDFLNEDGAVVGQHRGAVRYTIGQRKGGLHLAMGTPVYVCGKDMAANTVSVGPESSL